MYKCNICKTKFRSLRTQPSCPKCKAENIDYNDEYFLNLTKDELDKMKDKWQRERIVIIRKLWLENQRKKDKVKASNIQQIQKKQLNKMEELENGNNTKDSN